MMARKIDWQKQLLRSKALEQWRRYRDAVKAKRAARDEGADQ